MEKKVGVLACNRYEIPYRVYGNSPHLIVCVSGAKQTMSAWHSFVRFFKHQYSVLVFDLPGQGRSKILGASSEVSLSDQVDVLDRILKKIDVMNFESRFLIGGSWGSIVAAAYLSEHSDIFERAILGSFGTKPNSIMTSVIGTVQEYIEQGRGAEIAPLMIDTFGQSIPDSLKRQMISQFNEMSQAQFEAFYEHSRTVQKMGDLKAYISLSSIAIPVLVLMGQCDTVMDLFDARSASEQMCHGEFRIIDNVGHFLHWERPEIMVDYASFFQAADLVTSPVKVST